METFRGNKYSIHFDSMFDFMEHVDKEVNSKEGINKREFMRDYYYRGGHRWFGPTASSTKEIIDKAVVGDDILYERYLLPKISKLDNYFLDSDELTKVPVVKRKKVKRDFGDEIDIHLVNQGKIDRAWTTTERVEVDQEHHLTTILINITVSAMTDANDTLWTAASVLKLNDILQSAGKNVQIVVGGISDSCTASGKTVDWSINVKRYHEHLTVERLAVMSNAMFLRSVGFLAMDSCSERLRSNKGYPLNFMESHSLLPDFIVDELSAGNTKMLILNPSLTLDGAIRTIAASSKVLRK